MMRLAVDVATPSGIDRNAVEHALGVAATDLRVHLVGDAELLRDLVDAIDPDPLTRAATTIVPANGAIAAAPDADRLVRGHADASVRVAMALLRRGEVDAAASVAPGPVVASAAGFVLGRLPGFGRPVLAAVVDGVTVLYAGDAVTATGSDLASAAAAVAHPGARIGLLEPAGSARSGLDAFRALVAVRWPGDPNRVVAVDAAGVLDGVVDVVACHGALGATFVDTVRTLRPSLVGDLQRVVGVPAAVAALLGSGSPTAMASLTSPGSVGGERSVA